MPLKTSDALVDPLISLKKEFLDNPYPTYARFREEAPVFWSKKGDYWLVSKYVDANDILRDLSYEKGPPKWKTMDPLIKLLPQLFPNLKQQFEFRGKSMLQQNPPDHTRMRGLVNKAFTPSMISRLRSHIQDIADKLIDQIEAKKTGEMDLVSEYAYLLPITVISEMLGIPEGDREQFKSWSQSLTEALEPTFSLPKIQKAGKANREIIQYLTPLVEERRKNPQEDLISALVQAEEAGDKLSYQELLANLILLLVAGHETTVNLIGNGTLALLRNPDQLALLRSKPELINTAVEEFLRYESPVQLVRRQCGQDLELGGQKMKEGQSMFLLIGSANHDPEQFANPEKLDITRTPNKHLAFGAGIHHCLGFSLAGTEGQIAINTLINRLPNLALKKDARLEVRKPFALRGMKAIPVGF